MGKLIAFIFDLSKGGAQGVFVNLVNYFFENGVDVEVVVQSLRDPIYKEELHPEIRVTSLEVNGAREMMPKLINYIKYNSTDTVLAFSPEIAVNLYFARLITKKNYVIIGRCLNTLSYEYKFVKSPFRRIVTKNLIKMFYHRIDYSIAQSIGMADDLVRNFHWNKDKIFTISNALTSNYESELLESNPYGQRKNYLLYVGRLEEQKGLKMLIDAFSKIENKSITLKIVGSGSQKEELKKLSIELKIQDRVEFIEHTKQIKNYYINAKLCVLSSYFEGFPNVLVEALACGTPIVAFDLPSGPKEIIIEGENGFLADYLSIDDLVRNINNALDINWDDSVIKKSAYRYKREIIMSHYYDKISNASKYIS